MSQEHSEFRGRLHWALWHHKGADSQNCISWKEEKDKRMKLTHNKKQSYLEDFDIFFSQI